MRRVSKHTMRDEINGADARRPEEARPSRTRRTSQGAAGEGNAADAPFISSRPHTITYIIAAIVLVAAISALFYIKSGARKPPVKTDVSSAGMEDKIRERGETLYKQKIYSPLVAVYQKLLEKMPGNLAIKEKLAFAYFGAGQYSEAKPLLEEVTRAGRGSAEAFYELSYIEFNEGNVEAAKKHLAESLKLDPNHADAAKLKQKMK